MFVEALPESVNGTTCSYSEILYRYSDFSLQDIPAYFVEFLAAACSNLLWPVIQVPYFPLPLLYQHRAFLFAFSLRSLCIIKFFRASPLLNSTFSHYHFSGHFLTLSSRFVSTNKKKPTHPHGQIGLGENNKHYFDFFISAYLYGKGIPFSYSRNCISASIRLRLTGYSLHFHWFSWSFR